MTAAVSPTEAGVAQGSGGEADVLVLVLAPLRAEVDGLVHPGVVQLLVVARRPAVTIRSRRRTFIVQSSTAGWRGRPTCDW